MQKINLIPDQAFIQALLSTAVFPQRLSFFPTYLVQWLRGVTPWWTTKGDFWNLGLQITVKCIFLGFFFLKFRVLLGVLKKSCARKIHTTFLYACLEVSKPKRKTNR